MKNLGKRWIFISMWVDTEYFQFGRNFREIFEICVILNVLEKNL